MFRILFLVALLSLPTTAAAEPETWSPTDPAQRWADAATTIGEVLVESSEAFARIGIDLTLHLAQTGADAAGSTAETSSAHTQRGADDAVRYRAHLIDWTAWFAAYIQGAPERCEQEGAAVLERALDLAYDLRCRSVPLAHDVTGAA